VNLWTPVVGSVPAVLGVIAIGREAGFDWFRAIVFAYIIVGWAASAGYLYGRGQRPSN
jgi:hypothetical protein